MQRKRTFGSYIDKERFCSFRQLLVETAGAWDHEETAIESALNSFSPDERGILIDVAEGKELSTTRLQEVVRIRARLMNLFDRRQLAEHLVSLSPDMYLRSFVVYYVHLRQLKSLPDYRAICARATRYLGRNARVRDLTEEFISEWRTTLTERSACKIANALIRAVRLLVFGQRANVTHLLFWTKLQLARYCRYTAQLKGMVGEIPQSVFWQLFASVTADLGYSFVDARSLSQSDIQRQAGRLSVRTIRLLRKLSIPVTQPIFVCVHRESIARMHRKNCWASGPIPAMLSPKEVEVVKLAADGASKRRIR